jgi:hypothetical protein
VRVEAPVPLNGKAISCLPQLAECRTRSSVIPMLTGGDAGGELSEECHLSVQKETAT